MAATREALDWIGYRIDDVYGARVGKLEDVYVDDGTGEPVWMLARLGRFGDDHVLIPLADAVAGSASVWVPYERQQIKASPPLPAGGVLTRSHDLALARHYGIDRRRAAEIGGGAASEVTASATGAAAASIPALAR